MPPQMNVENNERIGRLETAVEGFHGELGDIKQTLKGIQSTLSRSKETNWSVVLSGIALMGSIYAAAIRPLEKDSERHEKQGETLATAVVVHEQKTDSLRSDIVKLSSEVSVLKQQFADVYTHGSPITDRRLTLLEYRIKQVELRKP